MREFTKSPLFLKIISLVCAVILWIYVIQVENPNINIAVSNIPIKYINQEIMEGNNLMLVSEMEETVTVTVQGRRKNITGLNADNMDVLADSPIKGIAVVSAVMKADNPCAAAAHIKEKFLKMMNK